MTFMEAKVTMSFMDLNHIEDQFLYSKAMQITKLMVEKEMI